HPFSVISKRICLSRLATWQQACCSTILWRRSDQRFTTKQSRMRKRESSNASHILKANSMRLSCSIGPTPTASERRNAESFIGVPPRHPFECNGDLSTVDDPIIVSLAVRSDAVSARANRKLSRQYLLEESHASFACSVWWV